MATASTQFYIADLTISLNRRVRDLQINALDANAVALQISQATSVLENIGDDVDATFTPFTDNSSVSVAQLHAYEKVLESEKLQIETDINCINSQLDFWKDYQKEEIQKEQQFGN